MTSKSFKKDLTMMILKRRFLNDGSKSLMVSKQINQLHNDGNKSLKRFLNDGTREKLFNDGTKIVLQWWY